MLVACVRRNRRQLGVCRDGAGGMRWRWRIRRIVEAPTRWPSLTNSPWIRMYPPARVLSRHPHYKGGEDVLDRWPSGPVRIGPSSADEAAMPAQDRVRGDYSAAPQRSRQPPHERDEHGPVRPVQPWSWVGAAQDGDLVAQHEELDVLGGGRTAHR